MTTFTGDLEYITKTADGLSLECTAGGLAHKFILETTPDDTQLQELAQKRGGPITVTHNQRKASRIEAGREGNVLVLEA